MTDVSGDTDLLFGSFLTPAAQQPERVVALARLCEQAGLDLVTLQDHPYQPAFLDTWTLLSYLAGVTTRIRLTPNVLNLPLRPPLVVARSVASLDLLSGGRVELGIGAGAFWDAIEAAGGRRLSPAQSIDALEEAIAVIRQVWATDQRGGVRVEGDHYRVVGAKRGPAPAHPIGIWIGAYKPRMLRLTGRVGDGWLPSLGYLPNGPADLAELNAHIDGGAAEAGRDPREIRRLLNISGRFAATSHGLLDGPADQWAEDLAGIALDHGFTGFVLVTDDPATIERYGQEVAPAVRELVAAERRPAPDPAPAAVRVGDSGLGQHLVEVHDHLRAELRQVRDLIDQVEQGSLTAAAARSAINEMTIRQNNWTLGAYCASYCRLVTTHHSLEDQSLFPHLRRADPALAPVLDRLADEHVVIHEVLEGVDRALVEHMRDPGDFRGLHRAVDELSEALLSHLAYEEQQLVEPLSRHGFHPGRL